MKLFALLLTFILPAIAYSQELPNPQPTKAHQMLAEEAGAWECHVKMYFQGPLGPASEFEGREVNKLVSGGLFLQTTFTCDMGERTFEGHSLLGYDPRKEQYTGVWVDNFTSVPTPQAGIYDAEKKTFTVLSSAFDPDTKSEMKQKQITTWTDKDNKHFVIYILVEAEGKTVEVKLMEMTAKRIPERQ